MVSVQYPAWSSSPGRARGSRQAAGCQPAPSRATARWSGGSGAGGRAGSVTGSPRASRAWPYSSNETALSTIPLGKYQLGGKGQLSAGSYAGLGDRADSRGRGRGRGLTVERRESVPARVLEAVAGIGNQLEPTAALERIVSAAVGLTGARYGALGLIGEGGPLSRFL